MNGSIEVVITTYATLASGYRPLLKREEEFKAAQKKEKNMSTGSWSLQNGQDTWTDDADGFAVPSGDDYEAPERWGGTVLHRLRWQRVVLDEAHIVKDPGTLQSKAVCALEADRRWCVTGTPLVRYFAA
jgi:SNF2 family DNA or RNA helicase